MNQLRTTAELRMGDARALVDVEHNDRNNCAIYMAGLVVEILLKARLLTTHPWLQGRRQPPADEANRQLWLRLNFNHDLTDLAENDHGVYDLIENRGGAKVRKAFQQVCGIWTVNIRYASKVMRRDEAVWWVDTVEEIRACLL